MKKLFLILVLSRVVILSSAQIPNATQKSTFNFIYDRYSLSSVDSVPGASADELYANALKWIYDTWGDSGFIEKTQDSNLRFIRIKGFLIEDKTSATLELQFKDNRYKWVLKEYTFIPPAVVAHLLSKSPIEKQPRFTKLNKDEQIIKLKQISDVFVLAMRKALLKVEDNW